MSIINIGLSLALVKPCGVFGVLIATPISRLVTQTWFDPYVVYKYVFKKSPKPYYKEFVIHSMITLVTGALIWGILEFTHVGSGLIRLVLGMILCCTIPLMVYYLLFRKDQQFIQLVRMMKRLIKGKR